MGYLRSTIKKCACGARANCELVNRSNSVIGAYCPRCGEKALHACIREEQAMDGVRAYQAEGETK